MNNSQPLEAIQDIKQMMERSSRFISLSGWSGIAAGCCGLVSAWAAHNILSGSQQVSTTVADEYANGVTIQQLPTDRLFLVAVLTFAAAFICAFIFTWLRSRKQKFSLWGTASRKLMWNVVIPMVVGGLFILKLIDLRVYGLIVPACLVFYGLALVNASKYTLGEIRYLGYGQIVLGLLNCWAIDYGLYFWAAGFGILHIAYGALMLWKYERS